MFTHRLALLACCALLGGLAVTGPAASAEDPDTPVYCPMGTMTGYADFGANGIGLTPADNSYTLSLNGLCNAPTDALSTIGQSTSDDSGFYSLTLTGTTVQETYAHGTSNDGVVTGYGPEGSIDGWFWYHRENVHYWISGYFVSGGETHRFWIWPDIIPFDAEGGIDTSGRMYRAGLRAHAGIFDPGDRSQEVFNVADPVVAAIAGVEVVAEGVVGEELRQVDPTICPVLVSFAPGVPGVVDIEPDGDVWALGGPAYDCPPYAD